MSQAFEYLSIALVMLTVPLGIIVALADRRPDPLRRPLAVFGLVVLASTLWSGHAGRLVGVAAFANTYLIMRGLHFLDDDAHDALAFVAGLIGGIEGASIYLLGRTTGVLINPNAAADLVLLTIPVPMSIVFGILLSRGALAANILAMMAYQARRGIRPALIVLALVIGAAGLYVLYQLRPASVDSRLRTYAEAAQLFAQRPLFGWGADTYSTIARNEPGQSHADNALLTIASEMGVIGLAAWAYLVVSVIVVTVRSRSEIGIALLAFGIHQLADDTVWTPLVAITLAVTISRTISEGELKASSALAEVVS